MNATTSDIIVGCIILMSGLSMATWCGYQLWKINREGTTP